MHRLVAVFVVLVMTMFAACTVTPRVSTWNSPPKFKKVQVFNAALQAGTENGWQPTSSDRETGTMSFTKRISGTESILFTVNVTEQGNIVQVRTMTKTVGGIAVVGEHEKNLKDFHAALFRTLNISDPSEQKINVELAK
jgi:hypothetical protein